MADSRTTTDAVPQLLAGDFQAYFLEQSAVRIRLGMTAGALIFAGAAVADLWSMPRVVALWSVPFRFLVMCPLLLVVAWLSTTAARRLWHPPVTFAALLGAGLTVAGIVIHLRALGEPPTLERTYMMTIAIYMMAGMRAVPALVCSLTITLGITLAFAFLGPLEPEVRRGLFTLLGVNIMGAAAAFAFERTARVGFMSQLRLNEMAERDGLTGLWNRRHLDAHLVRAFRQAGREKVPVSLAMIDVDDFKNFNDTYGHQAGDDALRRVADALQQAARRPLDLVARYGGEEFLVLWYGADAADATRLAEECRAAVAGLELRNDGARAGPYLTASCGVASGLVDAEGHAEEFIAQADSALYAAKAAGRNCVELRPAFPLASD